MSKPNIYTKEIITPIGQMLAAATDGGIFFLGFGESPDIDFRLKRAIEELGGNFNRGNMPSSDVYSGNLHLQQLDSELKEYFAGKRRQFTIPVILSGTDFQKQAWKTLMEIPFGEAWSYSRQAAQMGNPKAVRAVGNANGKNKIAIVVPCHRVVAKGKSLGGYSGGLWRKEYLLKHEGPLITE